MATLRFIALRLLQAIPLLLGIALLSFLLMNLAPGDFLSHMRANPLIDDEPIRQQEIQFGLVDPKTGERTTWLWQFVVWLKNVCHGDFGYSFATLQPVGDIIGQRLLNTLWLGGVAMVIGLIVALPPGIYSAMRQYRWQDTTSSFVAFVGLSLPHVFLALLVVMFAAQTGWLPLNNMRSIDFETLSPTGKALDLLHHVIGPALVLGTGIMALYMRQMRGNLLDVLDAEYIRTARSKGLSEGVVVTKHGVRNAINPVITLFGYSISDLLSGSVLVEQVMGWPGLGFTVLEAVTKKDMYLVIATVLMGSVMLIVGNLIADLLLAWSDPRIRIS